jgi:peptide/nickel transport system substrate-binding protein
MTVRRLHYARMLFAAATVAALMGAANVRAAETLVIGQAGDGLTLDPHAFNGIVEASIMSNLFDPLIAFDKKMEIDLSKSLIERWENPQPDRWVIYLRRGVKFHNGAEMTAEDVAYSIDRMLNWKPFGAMTGIAFYINAFETVTIRDPYTIEVKTRGPFGPMLRHLRTVYVVHKGHVEKVIREKGIEEVGRQPIGTGAYKLVEWVSGDHVTMERFDGWFAGKAAVERVVMRQISNNATRTAALLSGEIHIAAELPPHDVPRVKSNSGMDVAVLDGMRTVNFKFDSVREETPGIPGMKNPLRDKRVRMAINHAIDANAIVKVVMNGFAKPADQIAGEQHFGWSPNVQRLPYDPDKAKKLLAEAGYPNGFPLRVDSTNNRYVNDEQICLAVAQMVTKVGIQGSCRARSKQIVFKEFYDKSILCCSMFVFSYVVPTADIAGNMETNFHTPTNDGKYGASNGGNPETPQFTNAEVDKLIEAAAQETVIEKRKAILNRASEAIMAEYPIVPLHYQNDIYGISKKIVWEPRPDYYLTMYDAKWR